MTKATSITPALGCRAELSGLTDDELLVRFRALPRDSHERATACEILVQRYERLVRSCVRQYRGSPEPVEDLMQVGYVGLLKAINNFDPAFGSSLSAYAAPCVSGEVKRHFRDKRWQVHVRRSAQELLLALRKATEQLTHTLGRQPNDEELIKLLGCSSDDLLEARQADMVFSAYSLDAPCLTGMTRPSSATSSVTRTRTWSTRSTWRPCPPTGTSFPSASSASW